MGWQSVEMVFLFVFIFVYVVESVFVFVFLSWCQGGGPSGTEFRDRRLLAPPTSPTLTLQSHCTAHTGCPKNVLVEQNHNQN